MRITTVLSRGIVLIMMALIVGSHGCREYVGSADYDSFPIAIRRVGSW
jgi:hypothetical protein